MIQSFSVEFPRIIADDSIDRVLPIILYNLLERYSHATQYALLRSSAFLVNLPLLMRDTNTDYQITDSHLCTNRVFDQGTDKFSWEGWIFICTSMRIFRQAKIYVCNFVHSITLKQFVISTRVIKFGRNIIILYEEIYEHTHAHTILCVYCI